ncbi:hypothetical protein [Corynebacterium glyciniphilum]|uniref:hypothetical protein n=1 Tax=Corynebacterium glyciniphilum TaxID=1404244 RepID=UPI002656194F|nr:hypothetical protein [Corynebacterium glyciniphilum]MDN6706087.1 hypothetical protein [Corynebacterium glyciniphilum]
MGNNDWGSPGPTGPAGNPWRQDEPVPSKAGGLATGIIVAAVAVVVLVIGLVAAGVWMWSSQGDGDESASPAFTAVPDDTTSSAPVSTQSTQSTQSSTPTQSPSRSPSPSPSPSPSERSGTSGTTGAPSNLTSQGWRGVSAATCNASDQWVFAGTNGEDHAVVCRVGERGDLYYRGYYNNRAAEYDIDMQRAGSGRWVTRSLDNNGSRVEISGSGVRVVDGDGDSVSSRDFTWSSEDDDR